MADDGASVITWTSAGQDGSGYGVYAQRYNAAGTPQAAEFRVNSFTAGHQDTPTFAADSAGNFIIAWQSANQDGSGRGIYAQRFTATGAAQGANFRVNSYTSSDQEYACAAMSADGDFVVTWASWLQDGSQEGVYAQRYSAAGAAQGSEFRANSFTASRQGAAAVAMDDQGDFVLAWESYGQDGSGFGIYSQRYDTFTLPAPPPSATVSGAMPTATGFKMPASRASPARW